MIRAVAFDLFDTLVDFVPERFPVVEINGKPERTTSRAAYDALLREGYAMPNFQAFHVMWIENTREVWAERDGDPEHREIPSLERFLRLVGRLVSIPAAERRRAAEVAVEVHMRAIIDSTTFEASRLRLLERIRKAGLPLGLVTNFDHAPAARRLIGRLGIGPMFEVILISEEAGYRKPSPRLFLGLAERMGVPPPEVLFVGDTYDADVAGPRAVGMPSAWLNPTGRPAPEGSPPPDFEIRRLEDVLPILGLGPAPAEKPR